MTPHPIYIFLKNKLDEVSSDLHFQIKCKSDGTSFGLHPVYILKNYINWMRCHLVYIFK